MNNNEIENFEQQCFKKGDVARNNSVEIYTADLAVQNIHVSGSK